LIGFFNDGFKDNPSISREIFGARQFLGDPPQGLFQQSQDGGRRVLPLEETF
jgi:hypothetical protein